MTVWYAQNSSVDINSAGMWHDSGGNDQDISTSDKTIILCANGKSNININQNITCYSISTAAEGGTSGGGFKIAGSYMIDGHVVGGSTFCLSINGAECTVVISGNVTGGSGFSGININDTTNIITLNITGDVTGGSAALAHGISVSSTTLAHQITIVGNLKGGTHSGTRGLTYGNLNMHVYITGNIEAGSGTFTPGALPFAGTITVNDGCIINSETSQATSTVIYNPNEDGSSYIRYPRSTGNTLDYPLQLASEYIKYGYWSGGIMGIYENFSGLSYITCSSIDCDCLWL
ncbi:MAG: hypothetical protein WCO84_09700 [bacterium]